MESPPLRTQADFPRLPLSRYEIRIAENGEPLVPIPSDGRFAFQDPHPYLAIGAPYAGASPFVLRKSVLSRLETAATLLDGERPGFRLKIFDAYRPLEVQSFMVEHVADEFCRRVANIVLAEADEELEMLAYEHAGTLWAPATDNPYMPPPHSTWAAVDLTVVDASGKELDMGSLIDEHDNAHPESFAESATEQGRACHENRELLRRVMESAGFSRLPHEWWHFSFGDQHDAFARLTAGEIDRKDAVAVYGRVGAEYPERRR